MSTVAVIQLDNRYCSTASNRTVHATIALTGETGSSWRNATRVCGVIVDENAAADSFWWVTAALNAAWARVHGYAFFLYCVPNCLHADSGEQRAVRWCKVVALADAMARGHDIVLYLDTDAAWKVPAVSLDDGLLNAAWGNQWLTNSFDEWWPNPNKPRHSDHARWWPRSSNSSSRRPVFMQFGCNSPWDRCGVPWNFSAVHASEGSATTGVILARNSLPARQLLREWWHARNGLAAPHERRRKMSCSDQAVLWRMWTARPDLAAAMRVLSNDRYRHGGCMGAVSNLMHQRKSPIQHLTSFSPAHRKTGFASSWRKHAPTWHSADWCFIRVDLDAAAASSTYFGHVDSGQGAHGPWFANTYRQRHVNV